jgi:hypothetical protein
VKIQVDVYWVVAPRGVVVGYQRFGGVFCFHLQVEVTGTGTVMNPVSTSETRAPTHISIIITYSFFFLHCLIPYPSSVFVCLFYSVVGRTLLAQYRVKLQLLVKTVTKIMVPYRHSLCELWDRSF